MATGPGNTVYLKLPYEGAGVTFNENLTQDNDIHKDLTFDTYYVLSPGKFEIGGVMGTVAIRGNITISKGTVSLAKNLRLELRGNNTLIMYNGTGFNGAGELVFSTNRGTHTLLLGNPHDPHPIGPVSVFFYNMGVQKASGSVEVKGQFDTDKNSIQILNRLDLDSGFLEMGNHDIVVKARCDGVNPGISISSGAVIEGTGTFVLEVQESKQGGFPNTLDDAFVIAGDGNLNMAFDKITDAGVVFELDELGVGNVSFNRVGALYITEAIQFNGSFRAEQESRTEFWHLKTITGDLEVVGPNTSVYFFTTAVIEGDVHLEDTNNPQTQDKVEGLFFAAEHLSGPFNPHQAFSTIEGTFYAKGTSGVFLGAETFVHNLSIEGDIVFDESPIFVLEKPADAHPRGDLCAPYTNAASGNKVSFTGGDSQTLCYNTPLHIPSVKIKKRVSGQEVVIDPNSPPFVIDTSLEIMRGTFVTNGRLDANSGTIFSEGATVVINRDDDGEGLINRGGAPGAYISDAPEHTPRKIKYLGSISHSTGDEIPGPLPGSGASDYEITLDEFEVFMASDAPTITVIKSFTIATQLTLTRGLLDIGSAKIKLANRLQCAIGDSHISDSGSIFNKGELIFPTENETDFKAGEDGIDLLYFGTTDRTVGLEWPPAETTVWGRKTDPEAVRNVIINPGCKGYKIITSLREDDSRYRINGDLNIIAGALDIVGNALDLMGKVEIYPDGDLYDSLDDRAVTKHDQLRGEALPRVESDTPILFYSCFISYSTDKDFVRKLHEDLEKAGVRCFFDEVDMKGGKKIQHQITEALRNHDKLLLVLSENSINSTWVETEIKTVRKLEIQEGRQRLFPITLINYETLKAWQLFDADEGRDLAEEIRSYYIPDFSNWQSDLEYNSEFNKLLRDLRAEKT